MLVHPHARRTKGMYAFILIEPTFTPGADNSAQDLADCNPDSGKKSAMQCDQRDRYNSLKTINVESSSSVRNGSL